MYVYKYIIYILGSNDKYISEYSAKVNHSWVKRGHYMQQGRRIVIIYIYTLSSHYIYVYTGWYIYGAGFYLSSDAFTPRI